MIRVLGIAAVAALTLLPACGSSDTANPPVETGGQGATTPPPTDGATSSTGSPTATPPPGEIAIVDFEFSPRELTVPRGETVTWRNQDPYAHWVVSTQTDVLDSGELSQAQTYSKTFSQTGTFTYYCNIHNYMKATVVVR